MPEPACRSAVPGGTKRGRKTTGKAGREREDVGFSVNMSTGKEPIINDTFHTVFQATHDTYHVVKRLRAKQFTNILLFSRPMPHPLSEITSKNEEEKCLKNREAVRDLIVIDVCIS